MNSLLIKNVLLNQVQTNIYCQDGLITSLSDDIQEADKVIDGKGLIAHPPFINSHTHAAMTLFRGNGDDLPLMEWLQNRVWPYENNIRKEEIYWGTKLAIVEMIRSGITFFADMYWDFHAVAQAVEEMGVRASLSAVFIDFEDEKVAKAQRKKNIELLKESEQYSDRILYSLGPHAIYTVSEDSLRWAGEFAAENDIFLHIHLSETQNEVKDCLDKHGCTPVKYLSKLNCLSNKMIAAHTAVLNEEDIELLSSNKVLCVHNPVSNMKLAVGGVYPYAELKKAGALTALGTDGAGSNNNLDIIEEMKIAALLQKYHYNDQTVLPASEAIEMVTSQPSSFFNLGCHSIELGNKADFILLNPNRPEMKPLHDLSSHLVYAANANVVDSVICDGKVLMEHGIIEGEEEIINRAEEEAYSLFKRVDSQK